jgi:electron transport protein HydN
MMRLTPFIHRDASACTGCRLCEIACQTRDLAGRTAGCLEAPVVPRMRADRRDAAVALAFCTHCEEPACLSACPEGALIRQATGAVAVDAARCRGCPSCVEACPLGTIRITPDGLARKCDLCLTRSGGPACVQACPEKALVRLEPRPDRKEKNLAAALTLLASFSGRPAAGDAEDRTHKQAGKS